MSLGVVFGANKPGSKLQVPGFERAKIAFHQGQVFITIVDGLRVGRGGFEIGFHHVAAVQLRGGLERLLIKGQDQAFFLLGQL